MKQAFIYTDDKSQKFWIINSDGSDIMVNFGKLGTAGRYQITEYGSEAECQKAAAKLIKQLEKEMLTHAKNLEFEQAAALRDRIKHIEQSVYIEQA